MDLQELLQNAIRAGGKAKKLAKRARKLLSKQEKLQREIKNLEQKVEELLISSQAMPSHRAESELPGKLLGLSAYTMSDDIPLAFFIWKGVIYQVLPEVALFALMYIYKIVKCYEKLYKLRMQLQEVVEMIKAEIQ